LFCNLIYTICWQLSRSNSPRIFRLQIFFFMRRNGNDGRRSGRIQREGVRAVPRQRDHAQRVRDLRVRPLHQEQVSGEAGPSCQAPLQG
jgi:hypothetical protein